MRYEYNYLHCCRYYIYYEMFYTLCLKHSINVMINLVKWRIQNQSIFRRDYAMKGMGVQYTISSYLWISHP